MLNKREGEGIKNRGRGVKKRTFSLPVTANHLFSIYFFCQAEYVEEKNVENNETSNSLLSQIITVLATVKREIEREIIKQTLYDETCGQVFHRTSVFCFFFSSTYLEHKAFALLFTTLLSMLTLLLDALSLSLSLSHCLYLSKFTLLWPSPL